MTSEQLNSIKESLLQKGFTEEQANEILSVLPNDELMPFTPSENVDPLEDFIMSLLEKEPIQKILQSWATSQEKNIAFKHEEQKRFFSFLSSLDKRQKLYNIGFMVAGCGVVYGLKATSVIGGETATALATLIIGASLTDAISSFMKTQKRD